MMTFLSTTHHSDPDYEWAFKDLGGVSVPVAMEANGTWVDPNGDNVMVSRAES